jgi:hypothetical protein
MDMALPFDLCECVSSDGTDGRVAKASGIPSARAGRPSQAIQVPPGLVARVQAYDVEAFRELVRLTYVSLVRFAGTIGRRS